MPYSRSGSAHNDHARAPASCWAFYPEQRQLQYGTIQLTLTPTECRFLLTLLHWPINTIVSRSVLLSALPSPSTEHRADTATVQPANDSSVSPRQRALNMVVSRLRHKARQAGAILPLQTVSREGYALLAPIAMLSRTNHTL